MAAPLFHIFIFLILFQPLTAPSVKEKSMRLENRPFVGAPDAPVTIVEFLDLQCGSCRYYHFNTGKKLKQEFGKKVRFVFKPIQISPRHDWARVAARASLCYWNTNPRTYFNFISGLFARQRTIRKKTFDKEMRSLIKQTRGNLRAFEKCMKVKKEPKIILEDIEDQKSFSVRSTPTVFVNGTKFTGNVPYEKIASLVRKLLAKK